MMSQAPSVLRVPRRTKLRTASTRGFTIVEVVVAMGVLLLGMSSILGLLTFGATLSRAAELRTVGSSAVAAIVRDLEDNLFPLEADEPFGPAGIPPAEVTGELAGGIRYTARTKPNPDQLDLPGGPLEYRVDMELTWQSGGETRRRDFTTLFIREVPFGARLRRHFIASPDELDLKGTPSGPNRD